MRAITEDILRLELRNSQPEVYYIPTGKILTPAAREYLQQRKIKIAKEGECPQRAPEGDAASETKARTYLGSIRYTRQETAHAIRELSGGQKAKLLLTKMMLDGVNVLLLDEPTRNFSPISGPRVREALSDYQGTIISVSHDRKFLAEVCDKLYRFTERGLIPVEKQAL